MLFYIYATHNFSFCAYIFTTTNNQNGNNIKLAVASSYVPSKNSNQ